MFQRMFKPISIFFLVTVVLVALFVSPVAVYSQGTDPLLVILAFNDAMNAHDANAALAFFADDAIATVGGPPPNVGKKEIRTWLEADIADNIHVEAKNYKVVGDKVTWIGKVSVDSFKPLGVDSTEGPAEAVVQGGKIKSFTFTPNQESLAKLELFPVIMAFHVAYNAHDMDATLALFTDDAVVDFPGQPPPNVLTGKKQLRTGWLEGDFAFNIHQVLLVESLQVAGDKVTWKAKGSADFLQKLGIASLDAMGEAVIKDGKIKSFSAIFPPESLAKLNAAVLVTANQEGANSHKDIDAMVALFTDDAVVTFAGQPLPNTLIGKEEIRAWQQAEFADNSHIECGNLKVSGDKVTFTLKLSSDTLLKMGVVPPPLESKVEAVIQEGKYKSLTVTFDPESLAKLNAAFLIAAVQEGANAHKDIDAMANFFTDDAVVTFAGQPPPNTLTSKEEIRAWQEMEFADNSHIECGNLKVSGNKVTSTLKYSSDSLLKLGVVPPPLESTVEAVIQDGKFKSYTVTFDPESLAKLNAAILVIALQEGANAHKDIDAMVALFTDDAVVAFPNQSLVFKGKDEIRAWQQAEFANESHLEGSNLRVAGNKLTWTLKLSAKDLRELGIDSVDGPVEAVVQGGKFKSFTFNLSQESLAKIECAMAKTGEDFSHVFFMSLDPGLNMVSLPLKPSKAYTARSFASELGATIVVRYDEVKGRFEGFAVNAKGDGFSIEGGKGYIVNTPKGGAIAFIGAAWTNKPPVKGAPSAIQTSSAWAFLVNGLVLDGDMMSVGNGNYTVTVRNLNAGMVVSESVSADGYFANAYADLSRKAVIKLGDKIEVAVTDSSGELVAGPFVYTISQNEITNAFLNVHLKLGDIVPKITSLLQNFPNPFNPETWIPFQLKNASDVTIKIFNAAGRLVRTLELGRKDPGVYTSQIKAAHWDGKNDSGDEVSSGVYFYNIKAGDFSATRKMIVKK